MLQNKPVLKAQVCFCSIFQTVCYNKNMSDNKTLNKAKREKYNE